MNRDLLREVQRATENLLQLANLLIEIASQFQRMANENQMNGDHAVQADDSDEVSLEFSEISFGSSDDTTSSEDSLYEEYHEYVTLGTHFSVFGSGESMAEIENSDLISVYDLETSSSEYSTDSSGF